MKASELDPSFRNDNGDMIARQDRMASRKPTITLVSLNKLKKMRAAKDLENLMRGDFLEIIYASGAEEGAGGGGL